MDSINICKEDEIKNLLNVGELKAIDLKLVLEMFKEIKDDLCNIKQTSQACFTYVGVNWDTHSLFHMESM